MTLAERRREDLDASYQLNGPNRWKVYLKHEPDLCCQHVNRDNKGFARCQDLIVFDLGKLEMIELEEMLSKYKPKFKCLGF